MAKYTTLSSLFTAIADAIRAKKGTNDVIAANNFPIEIAGIDSGGEGEVGGSSATPTTYANLASLFTAIADAIRAKKGTSGAIIADNFPDEIAGIEAVKYVTIGSLPVGSIISLDINGEPRNFIVVHQGNPDTSIYDKSCDGTWLLMEDIYEKRSWGCSFNDSFMMSDLRVYLNDRFFDLFNSGVKSAIKRAILPCQIYNGTTYVVENELIAYIFVLSVRELGWGPDVGVGIVGTPDGACLDYFKGLSEGDSKYIAFYNGDASNWTLRGTLGDIHYVTSIGKYDHGGLNSAFGIRPAMILDSSFLIPKPSQSSPDTGDIPTTYTQVNYIESNGTQYINTGYCVTSENVKIVTTFSISEIQGWHALFGCEETNSGPWTLTPLINGASAITFYSGKSSQLGSIPVLANTIYSLTCQSNNGVITYDCNGNTATLHSQGALCKADNIYIFTINSAKDESVIDQASKMRVYSFQIYDNDVLVRDFKPCTNADGVAGLFDVVGQTFYTNSGTDAFTYA
jgi:hypothetical protein